MDNIVRDLAEIELTETELAAIYGAQNGTAIGDVIGIFNVLGTLVSISGTALVVTMHMVGGSFTRTVQ